jgi:hypothetical protein
MAAAGEAGQQLANTCLRESIGTPHPLTQLQQSPVTSAIPSADGGMKNSVHSQDQN